MLQSIPKPGLNQSINQRRVKLECAQETWAGELLSIQIYKYKY
jgi:hypothetical protein